MIKGIGHSAYVAADMEKSLDFYCRVLGLKHAFSIKNDRGEPWIEYLKVADGQFIEFFYGNANNTENQSYSHFCLVVDDINEIARRLRASGAILDVEPVQGKDLNYQCWTRDPDNNRIEFMQMHPESPQNKA